MKRTTPGLLIVLFLLFVDCGPLRYITVEDRQAQADGRAKVEAIQTAAQAQGLITTAETARSAVANIAQGQAAMGAPATATVAESIKTGLAAEMAQDPRERRALEAQARIMGLEHDLGEQKVREMQLARDAEDRRQQIETWKGRVVTWGLPAIGGTGALAIALSLIGAAKKYGPEVMAAASALQEVKHANEAGKTVDVAEVIQRHAAKLKTGKLLAKAHRRIKAASAPPAPKRPRLATAREKLRALKDGTARLIGRKPKA